MNIIRRRTMTFASAVALASSLATQPSCAQSNQETVAINIEEQRLDTALNLIARRYDMQVVIYSEDARSRRVAALNGEFTLTQALDRVLRGTGLEYVFVNGNTIGVGTPERLNAVRQAETPRSNTVSASGNAILVTGTRIPGAEPTSQTVVITREEIESRGYTTPEEALRSLPQFLGTFGANANALGGNGNIEISTSNTAGQSAANLRGLGPANVLVLVNGRRTSASSALGLFGGDESVNGTNLATIPFAAVERMEIILDGASAIYGSDAVGGVINFILRSDYSGGELSAYYEDGESGGRELRFSGVFGQTWSGGHVTVSGEYAHTNPVMSADIGFTTNDYREISDSPFAVDQRFPGEPLRIRTRSSSTILGYFDPQGGSPVINQDDVDGISGRIVDDIPGPLIDQIEPELLPETERYTLTLGAEQELFTNFTLLAGASYSSSKTVRNQRPASPEVNTFRIIIQPGTPFNASTTELRPRGYLPYGISDTLPDVVLTNESERFSWYGGFEYDLSDVIGPNWLVAFDYNNDLSTENQSALNDVRFSPIAFNQLANDGIINPWLNLADQPAVAQAVEDRDSFFGRGAQTQSFTEQFQLSARGSLFELPGGLAGIAFGGELRRDGYNLDETALRNGGAGLEFNITDPETKLHAVYAELNLPVLEALEVSLSGRYDHYSATGESEELGSIDNTYEAFSPRIGVAFYPVPSVKLRGNWQKSLRAPSLAQLFIAPRSVFPFFPPTDHLHPSGTPTRPAPFTVLQTSRGNPNLEAERSESWSLGADWEVNFIQGLKLSVNYNNTKIDDAFESSIDIFRNPDAFIAGGPTVYGLVVRDEDGFMEQVFLQPINIASASSESLDFFVDYGRDFDFGRLELIVNSTRNLENSRVLVEGAEGVVVEDQLGSIRGPSKWNHFAQLSWSDGPMRVNLLMNHVGGFTNDGYSAFLSNVRSDEPYLAAQLEPLVTPADQIPGSTRDDIIQKVGSFTTFDLFGQYRFDSSGLRVTAGIENLFDTEPPYIFTPRGVPFSSGRHDPFGRRFSLRLTKEF